MHTFFISTDANCHVFVSIFNGLTMPGYVPRFDPLFKSRWKLIYIQSTSFLFHWIKIHQNNNLHKCSSVCRRDVPGRQRSGRFAFAEWEIAVAAVKHKGTNQLKWKLNTVLACEERPPQGRNNSPLDHLSRSGTLKWSDLHGRRVPSMNKGTTFIKQRVSWLEQSHSGWSSTLMSVTAFHLAAHWTIHLWKPCLNPSGPRAWEKNILR